MRTSVYSGFHPYRVGTEPFQYSDSIDRFCTRNAPYNAINHLSNMEGNLNGIIRMNQIYPRVFLYSYDVGSAPSLGFKDYSFNMMDKKFVMYNARTEMYTEYIKLLRGHIFSFRY